MRIGFITCADLSRYFVSATNPLFTHDDQVAADFLVANGHSVSPVIWGTPYRKVQELFDLLIVRSPWDYMDSEETRVGFFNWLSELDRHGMRILNNFKILKWNLDKHYLQELQQAQVSIVPTTFLEVGDSDSILDALLSLHKQIVVKPCIAAAAKDAYLIENAAQLGQFKLHFASIRRDRAFMVQPFIAEVRSGGEWSLVFIGGEYSHGVHKLPKPGNWLVQDELGGTVASAEPPCDVASFAKDAYAKLSRLLDERFGRDGLLLYARVDVLGMGCARGLFVGELELVEPELFFKNRLTNQPNHEALERLLHSI